MIAHLYKQLLIVSLLLLVASGLAAQPKHFSHIENLPNKDVLDVIKDKYGFIWIAHESGIARFDGYDFVEYDIKDDNPNKLNLESVWRVFLDRDQQLWVGGGNNGCERYNYEKEEFQHYNQIFGNTSETIYSVKSFAQDTQGNIWMAGNGLFKYRKAEDVFELMGRFDTEGVDIGVIQSMLIDKSGTIWVGNGMGNLFRFDANKKAFERYDIGYFKDKCTVSRLITGLYQAKNGQIWVCGEGITVSINPQTNAQQSFSQYLLDPNKSTCVIEDDRGNLWFSAGGLNIYNSKNKTFEYYRSDDNLDYSISSNVTTELYLDNQSVIWLGTWYGGLNTYNYNKSPINLFSSIACDDHSLSNNVVHCMYEDKSHNIWVGTEDGLLNKLDTKTNKFVRYRDPSMRINEAITGIAKGRNEDELILGSWGSLKVFNMKTERFTRLINNVKIPSLIKGERNNIWLGVEMGGLSEYNLSTTSLLSHSGLASGNCWREINFVRHLYEDRFDNVWVVVWAGLFRYDIKNHCFKTIVQNNKDPFALGEGQVYCCFQDSKGRLWVGSNKGINLYNYNEDYFMQFGAKQGMAGNEVKSILEDKNGNLWLTTDKGISKFCLPQVESSITKDSTYVKHLPPQFTYFLNYDKHDGVQNERFLKGCLLATDSTMYFGGIGGLNSFKPEDVKKDTIISPIHFIEFRLFNKLVKPAHDSISTSPLKKSIVQTSEITLNADQYIFSLKWSSLNYYATAKVEYAYIMEGFEKDWSYVGSRRTASYTGLPPGEYIFRVKATNSNGVWNQGEASLKIIILPPWYSTWWFRLIIVLLVIGLTLSYTYFRLKGLRKRQQVLEAKVDESTKHLQEANATKDRFFSIIAHDLRNPFQTLLGYSDLLLDMGDEYTQAERTDVYKRINKTTEKTLDLLDNLLTWSMAQSGKMKYNPQRIDVSEYIAENISFLKGMADKKEIELINSFNSVLFIEADRNTSDTILRNLISNAIKFTQRLGEVSVSARQYVSEGVSVVEFCVADTGVGMSKDKASQLFKIDQNISTKGTEKETGTGLGLNLCQEFVHSNGGHIWVESEEGVGTKFYYTLPESKDKTLF